MSYKKSGDKPRLSLIPREALYAMGTGFNYGIKKHGIHRFKTSQITTTELCDSAVRHIFQFIDGEDFDGESKVFHLGAAMSNLAMATWVYYNKPKQDDRFCKQVKKGKK